MKFYGVGAMNDDDNDGAWPHLLFGQPTPLSSYSGLNSNPYHYFSCIHSNLYFLSK